MTLVERISHIVSAYAPVKGLGKCTAEVIKTIHAIVAHYEVTFEKPPHLSKVSGLLVCQILANKSVWW